MASILLGNVRGPQGDTGATGPKGDTGNAATVRAGSVTTVPYGQNAKVTNSGDEHDAVFDFVIPQGRPGEQTTDMENLTLSSMTEPSNQFPIPSIGDTGKVIFGKITKWFSDMTALVATKFPTSNVINNLTTTASGYALDARQGKALNDKVGSLFTVYDRQVYQSRISNATLKEIRYTLPDGRHMSIVYCVFKTEAAILAKGAIATGFSISLGLSNVIIGGIRSDTTASTHFYINSSGGLCAVEALPTGAWCQCGGVYLTNSQ